MNRILVVILGAAVVALVAFGVIVFTGTPPAPLEPDRAQPANAVRNEAPAQTPEAPAPARVETAAATQRFDAWAKPLRDAGLTVTADRVSEAGETISVSGLVLAEASEHMGWRWTAERASLYDRGLFHLQAAGATSFAVTTGPGWQVSWSGRADAIGMAVQRDVRDVLSRSLVVRINGLSLAEEGASAPLTLGEAQLRILLKGGTGLLPTGADLALRLTDVGLPRAAGSTLGATLKSFTTQLSVDRPITRYSLQQVLDFFTRGNETDVELGTIGVDWGALHFTGKGRFGLSPSGAPRARLEVRVSDALALLDSIAAAGGTASDVLAAEYAARLLELGRQPDQPALPMVISLEDGALVLEGVAGDIRLDAVAQRQGT